MYFINPPGSEVWAALQAIGGIAAIIAAFLIGSSQQRQERKFRKEDAEKQLAAEANARNEIATFINHLISDLADSLKSLVKEAERYAVPNGMIDWTMACYEKAPRLESDFARVQLQASNVMKRIDDEKDIFKIDVRHRIAWHELVNLISMISQRAKMYEETIRDYNLVEEDKVAAGDVELQNRKFNLAQRRGWIHELFGDDVDIFVSEVERIVAGRPFEP